MEGTGVQRVALSSPAHMPSDPLGLCIYRLLKGLEAIAPKGCLWIGGPGQDREGHRTDRLYVRKELGHQVWLCWDRPTAEMILCLFGIEVHQAH